MTDAPMSLQDLLSAYISSRETSSRYRESLKRTVRRATAAGLTSVAELQPEIVNRFLQKLSTPSATTKANIRRELMTLWRWAYEQRWTDEPALRVMKIKASARPPEAWSITELQRLLDCAERDEAPVGGVTTLRICDYMPCWILIAYDTGIRFSDLLALQCKHVRNGFVMTTARKTNKPLARPLSAYAAQWAQQLIRRSPDGSMFEWFLTRRRAILAMRSFVARHGFSGSTKYLRRSCATYIESERPGAASRYLQHSAPHLVQRHYLDESLLALPSGPPPIRPLSSATR